MSTFFIFTISRSRFADVDHDRCELSPPWPNKSAARGAQYETFDPYSLFNLNLASLLGDKGPCLVAVWVTNKLKVSFTICL